jgi:hypothetical protein
MPLFTTQGALDCYNSGAERAKRSISLNRMHPMSQDDSDRLVSAATVKDPTLAEVLRLALDAEGIPCEIDGSGQAGLTGTLPIKLLVKSSDESRAREILGTHASTNQSQ